MKQQKSILENIGNEEQLRFLPPPEIRDILNLSINDLYKIMCENRKARPIPPKEEIFNCTSNPSETLQDSHFFASFENCLVKETWFPSWLRKQQYSSTQLSFSNFVFLWTRYLSLLTPGEEITKLNHIILVSDYDIQDSIQEIYSAIHSIRFEELFQNDYLYQGVLSKLNVYMYSTSNETRVTICMSFSLEYETTLVLYLLPFPRLFISSTVYDDFASRSNSLLSKPASFCSSTVHLLFIRFFIVSFPNGTSP